MADESVSVRYRGHKEVSEIGVMIIGLGGLVVLSLIMFLDGRVSDILSTSNDDNYSG
jgi:hypothetical protein